MHGGGTPEPGGPVGGTAGTRTREERKREAHRQHGGGHPHRLDAFVAGYDDGQPLGRSPVHGRGDDPSGRQKATRPARAGSPGRNTAAESVGSAGAEEDAGEVVCAVMWRVLKLD
ncbi:hypothetical protein SHKM778_58900 [Streptomyces sp. KM77-8]|uniref:Uncharacterized protein n=1 Tax=Streptomyces haneummycinicus TaxID=3074435 RepID=A0AAT9HPK6_9ACTN